MVSSRMSGVAAYPRSRGEHQTALVHAIRREGLPPLARGARASLSALCASVRPTPARAGSTSREIRERGDPTAYPRSRGEHYDARWRKARKAGLPPLARGARLDEMSGVGTVRPTPARAGSTSPVAARPDLTAAYPRSRGEHPCEDQYLFRGLGLPPLARGAPASWPFRSRSSRPTPARAGSTPGGGPLEGSQSAYPRSRGEHAPPSIPRFVELGLPPLARGALFASSYWGPNTYDEAECTTGCVRA